jgi:hypothetical protein
MIDYPGIEALEIRYEGEIVGEWAGPDFVLLEDEHGKQYYKISIETWSILEEDIDLDL